MSTNKKLLILDTRDGTYLEGPAHTQWNISHAIQNLRGKINWVQVMALEIPHTFYNIDSTNNTIVLEVYLPDMVTPAAVPLLTYAVPEGHYTSTEFTAAITAGLSALPGADAYSSVIDANTGKWTLTNDAGNTIKFVYANNTIGRRIGLTEDSIVAASLTGQRSVDLRGITSLMVKSNISSVHAVNYSGPGGSISTFLAEAKVNEAYGKTVFWTNDNTHNVVQVGQSLPDIIELSLVSRKTVLINTRGFDWRISILIDYD